MKVSESVEILKQYDPSEDVVIAFNPHSTPTARTGYRPDIYYHFAVSEHVGQLGAKGRSTIVALEWQTRSTVILKRKKAVYFRPPFIKLKW